MAVTALEIKSCSPFAPQRGNQRLLLDIVNRGNPTVLTNLNSAVGHQDPGNGFLMRQGYTVLWCGWQDDVPATPGLIRIQVPEALDAAGQPITGKIAVTFQSDTPLRCTSSRIDCIGRTRQRTYTTRTPS